MKITIRETKTGKEISAQILKANKKDMPLKKDGWQFSWRKLYKDEDAMFFKLVLTKSKEVQGMLMLKLENDNLLTMKDIEIAPHNFGSKGKFDNVAGCLIAFACLKSFELGKGNYNGFLSFESKTSLIELYEKKYGAIIAWGQRMFFDKITGTLLIEKYLKLSL